MNGNSLGYAPTPQISETPRPPTRLDSIRNEAQSSIACPQGLTRKFRDE